MDSPHFISTPDEPAVELASKLLWATPTVSMLIQNSRHLTSRLAEIILKEEAALTSRKSVPVAGLQSGLTTQWQEYNVFNWQYAEVAELRGYVLRGFREFIKLTADPDDPRYSIAGLSCWANVLRPGQSLHVHHHDPAFCSAHFTVRSGDDAPGNTVNDAGHTIYYRPGFMDRSHGGMAAIAPSPWDDDWQLSARPVDGKLFFFPGYVRHEVRPYAGSTHRISIAMDIFIKMQKLPIYFGGERWHVP